MLAKNCFNLSFIVTPAQAGVPLACHCITKAGFPLSRE